ncbi:transposon Tf2-9 polyprotein [Trichonephila clavata]|uniref:Transposon Tf2-9 polyprotein n=1 Tax=Trichonephila clavata TaxID=2740835 RepID=A0A8X6I295_TRICU|nr:transposon Tf2-9 polyprotein [Trichonephila clavata]
MAEITAVKTPPYNFSDPQLWFSTCERTFALGVPKAITDTCTKFNCIVSNLPPEAAAIVRDLIITPDERIPMTPLSSTDPANWRVIATRNSEAVNRRRTWRQVAFRTPQDNE